ncbi:unnamed protein product [Miscanthus lutarioriparius]|uniref:F-box domain-containing protein n=1 Tax=Miscanthus lutarioriparius TaxID=422564 RepID=A0A811MTT7_9POAL|nr:unnamed protein product [Miscanthus lutarioriparius]
MATTAVVSASPSDCEPTAATDEGTTWWSLPTDSFTEILLHLPPSCRRMVRLVCRHWRAVIDGRTPPQSKPAVPACFTGITSASAYVIDADIATGPCRKVWGVNADPNARDDRRRVTMVFTLGDPSQAWRDVPVSFPGGATATCSVDAGLVPVDGATYWVTKGAERVVSFDHEDEHVAFAPPLPVEGGPGYVLRLMEVRGRLGLAVYADRWAPAKTDIWVLGRQLGWSGEVWRQECGGGVQRLPSATSASAGNHVLTVRALEHSLKHHLYAHGCMTRRGGCRAAR